MKNREAINNEEQIKEAFNLSMQIQNEGIGTVFTYLHGHTNDLEINIHTPCWLSGSRPDFRFKVYGEDGCTDSNDEAIKGMRDLLNQGKAEGDETALVEGKERQIRRQQFEALKAEFEPA